MSKRLEEKLPKIPKRSHIEIEILKQLKEFQKGYLERDITKVKSWVESLLDERVQIIGTNSIFPGDFEWRSGHEAAIEMFENDWKNWGDATLYIDQSEIEIELDSAWVVIFATVTRDTTKEKNRTFEASKQRSLQRIKSITEKEIPSTLALYEIFNDASSVLVQYARSEIFVWPIRITLGFLKKNNQWLIKQIHFSWPGRGFPAVRLFEE